jgi:hypothetical protein
LCRATALGEHALRVAVAVRHEAPVLGGIRLEDGERAEAAPLLGRLDDGDGTPWNFPSCMSA